MLYVSGSVTGTFQSLRSLMHIVSVLNSHEIESSKRVRTPCIKTEVAGDTTADLNIPNCEVQKMLHYNQHLGHTLAVAARGEDSNTGSRHNTQWKRETERARAR